jgi:hypothetical protein
LQLWLFSVPASPIFPRLAQSSDTADFQFVDQVQQHARGGPRVARSAMALSYLKAKVIR